MAFTSNDKKYHGAIINVLDYVSTRIAEGARVLEIGPGTEPFARATHAVDRFVDDNPDRTICDVDQSPLPFADKAFDFVYCRHIVEDLHNPYLLLSEMNRVGKAGYIETPSPLAEMARGIDGGSPAWRGYHHHRWLVWEQEDMLVLVGKYPAIEHVNIQDEARIYELLQRNPFLWNTYYFWEGTLRFKFLQHEIDFDISGDYNAVIEQGLTHSVSSAQRLVSKVKI